MQARTESGKAMVSWMQSLWAAPTLDTPERTRVAALLNTVLVAVLVAGLTLPAVLTLADVLFGSRRLTLDALVILLLGVVLAVLSLGLRWLVFRGWLSLAGSILTAALLILTTGSIAAYRGIRDVSIIGYVLAIIIAAQVLGSRAALVTGGLSILAAAAVYLAEITGYLVTPVDALPGSFEIITVSSALVVATLLLRHAVGTLRDVYDRLRRNEQAQLEISRALQATQRTLEARSRELEKRALQLQSAAEIARLATAQTAPRELVQSAVDLIRERFGLYHASVFFLDETGAWAELAASTGEAGRMLLARRHRLAVGSNSIVGWVTSRRAPRVASDVTQDPFHFRNPLLPDTQSEAAVPLLVGDRLLGALDVQSKSPNAFAEDDVRALEAIGGELAIAIDRARLTEETREELERIESMYRGRERASWARMAAQSGGRELRVGQPPGTEGQSAESFPSSERAARLASTVVEKDGREVAVPVQVRGQVIGTIAARRPLYGERWDDEDIAVIEAVANQAGVALEIARQYTEEQRRLTELEVINRISQGVSQRLRMDSLFRVVHSQINQLLGDVGMVIAAYGASTRTVVYLYAASRGQALHLQDEVLGDDQVSYLIRSQQPLLMNENVELQAAGIGIQLREPSFRCWMGAPMMVGDTVLGVMALFDPEVENRFADEDIGLLTTVASQLASAIQNAQLLEEVQRASRRDRLIREITSKVRRAPDIRSILEITAREIGRALNASRSTVRVAQEKLDVEADGGGGGSGPTASASETPGGRSQP